MQSKDICVSRDNLTINTAIISVTVISSPLSILNRAPAHTDAALVIRIALAD